MKRPASQSSQDDIAASGATDPRSQSTHVVEDAAAVALLAFPSSHAVH